MNFISTKLVLVSLLIVFLTVMLIAALKSSLLMADIPWAHVVVAAPECDCHE